METSSLELQSAEPEESTPIIGGSMRAGRFYRWLAGIVAFGLLFRIGYVLIVTRYENGKLYDAYWYGVTAAGFANGRFFSLRTGPTVAHPPLTSILLGLVNLVVTGNTVQRLTEAVLGAGVVLCVGLLGRSIAGPWVGLTAAALAAVYPNMWIPSGIVMSETPAMLFMALILLVVVRIYRSPSLGNAALLGVLCGAEALVRAELILFVPCLLFPAVLTVGRLSARRRLELLGIGLLTAGIVMAPWVGRNLATFQDPTYLSTGDGLALWGANCPGTYSGPLLGYWFVGCAYAAAHGPGDESVISDRGESLALTYASDHASRLPVVVLARIGRTWEFYAPIQGVNEGPDEGRPVPAQFAGLVFYFGLLPFGIAGIVILRRRCIRQWFLLVPAGVVTLIERVVLRDVSLQGPFRSLPSGFGGPGLRSVLPMVGRVRRKTRLY